MGRLLSGLSGSVFREIAQIPFLDSLAGPGRLAEKFQAGIDRRIEHKTADGDAVGQSRPTVSGDEGFENRLQVDAVKRIVGVGSQGGRLRFKIRNSKFKVQSSKFEVQSSKFEVQSSKFKVQSSKFKVQSSKFKVQSSKFKVQSSKFKVQSSSFPPRFSFQEG